MTLSLLKYPMIVIYLNCQLQLIQGSQEIIDLDLTLPDFYKRGQSTREQDICGFDPDKPGKQSCSYEMCLLQIILCVP